MLVGCRAKTQASDPRAQCFVTEMTESFVRRPKEDVLAPDMQLTMGSSSTLLVGRKYGFAWSALGFYWFSLGQHSDLCGTGVLMAMPEFLGRVNAPVHFIENLIELKLTGRPKTKCSCPEGASSSGERHASQECLCDSG